MIETREHEMTWSSDNVLDKVNVLDPRPKIVAPLSDFLQIFTHIPFTCSLLVYFVKTKYWDCKQNIRFKSKVKEGIHFHSKVRTSKSSLILNLGNNGFRDFRSTVKARAS